MSPWRASLRHVRRLSRWINPSVLFILLSGGWIKRCSLFLFLLMLTFCIYTHACHRISYVGLLFCPPLQLLTGLFCFSNYNWKLGVYFLKKGKWCQEKVFIFGMWLNQAVFFWINNPYRFVSTCMHVAEFVTHILNLILPTPPTAWRFCFHWQIQGVGC